MSRKPEPVVQLRTLLDRDIDDVLNEVYCVPRERLPAILEAAVTILCDKWSPMEIRVKAAEVVQTIGNGTPELLARVEQVRQDETEPQAVRSSALSACASLRVEGSK